MTHNRFGRKMRHLAAATALAALPGCFYGGSPGSGSQDAGSAGGVSAELDWADASGPVMGYRVFVSRNEGAFELDKDVATSSVTVDGEPMDTIRIQVAAFDALGQLGPLSEPSDLILLTAEGTALIISTASPAATADPSATTQGASLASAVGVGTKSVSAGTTATASDGSAASSQPSGGTVRGDLVGDGVADLLWEAGDFLRVTQLSGDAVTSLAVLVRPDRVWTSLGSADFDGDGLGDLLWRHDDGSLAYTPMATAVEAAPDAPLAPLAALVDGETVVGSGDLDADGLAELLVSDGRDLTAWYAGSGADVVIETVAAHADAGELEAVGDFDGDDRADLLWRTSEGGLRVWLMDGSAPTEVVDLTVAATAEVVACADLDGDGGDDVVARDPQTGALSIHPLATASWDVLPSASGLVLAGRGDYDGDGQAELLWDTGSGLELWSGLALGLVAPRAIVSDLNADWELVPDAL
jgi:hypothetical protein